MTKGELIFLVLQKVAGGKPNQDTSTSVRREDIEVYLPAAINYAMTKQYYITKREFGTSDFPSDFLATYIEEVKTDSEREERYIQLKQKPLSLPNDRGLRYVGSVRGNNGFTQISPTELSHNTFYTGSFNGVTGYYLEGSQVRFANISPTVDKVLVRMVGAISDTPDESDLPIPAGSELEVISLVEQFFLGQREIPSAMANNNREV